MKKRNLRFILHNLKYQINKNKERCSLSVQIRTGNQGECKFEYNQAINVNVVSTLSHFRSYQAYYRSQGNSLYIKIFKWFCFSLVTSSSTSFNRPILDK